MISLLLLNGLWCWKDNHHIDIDMMIVHGKIFFIITFYCIWDDNDHFCRVAGTIDWKRWVMGEGDVSDSRNYKG